MKINEGGGGGGEARLPMVSNIWEFVLCISWRKHLVWFPVIHIILKGDSICATCFFGAP